MAIPSSEHSEVGMARHEPQNEKLENTKAKYIIVEDLNQVNVITIGEHGDAIQAADPQHHARDAGDEHQEVSRNADSDLNELAFLS